MIKQNFKKIKEKLKDNVFLVAVSKTISVDKIKEAIECGIQILGENRVQEAFDKFCEIAKYKQELEAQKEAYGKAKFLENYQNLKWHLIGHLQKNKVKTAIKFADLIHSVDSLSLLQSINKHSRQTDKVQNILIQVNASSEESKFGLSVQDTKEFFEKITENEEEYCSNIKILGLMTIAPFTDDEKIIRDCFKNTKNLFDELKQQYFGYNFINMKYLSMGMSGDYELAISEGANMVRIGSAIFGTRNYS